VCCGVLGVLGSSVMGGTIRFVWHFPNNDNQQYGMKMTRNGTTYDISAFVGGIVNSQNAVANGPGDYILTNGLDSAQSSLYAGHWGLSTPFGNRTNAAGYATSHNLILSDELLHFYVSTAACTGTIDFPVCIQNFSASGKWYLIYTNGVEYIAPGSSARSAVPVDPGQRVCGTIVVNACDVPVVTSVGFDQNPYQNPDLQPSSDLTNTLYSLPDATNSPVRDLPNTPLIYNPTNYLTTNSPISYPSTNQVDIERTGFNAVYSAVRDETRIRSSYDDRALALLTIISTNGGGGSGGSGSNISVSVTVTNTEGDGMAMSNLVRQGFDVTTVSNSALGAVSASQGIIGGKISGMVPSVTLNSTAPDFTINIAGTDYDANPFQFAIVDEMAGWLRRLLAWLIRITYYLLVVGLVTQAYYASVSVPQARTPASGGGLVAGALGVGLAILAAVVIIGVYVAIPALLDSLLVSGYLTDFTDTPFADAGGNLGKMLYLFDKFFPVVVFLTYLGAGITARLTCLNTFVFVTAFVRRVPG